MSIFRQPASLPTKAFSPQQHDGLPDSTIPNGLCPRCLKQSSFEIGTKIPITFDSRQIEVNRDGSQTAAAREQAVTLTCRNCRQGIVIVEEYRTDGNSWRVPGGTRGGVVEFRGIHWWPTPEVRVSADVPEEISSALEEAIRALQASCPRASATMSRRTLEAITSSIGQNSGTLAERLKNLASAALQRARAVRR